MFTKHKNLTKSILNKVLESGNYSEKFSKDSEWYTTYWREATEKGPATSDKIYQRDCSNSNNSHRQSLETFVYGLDGKFIEIENYRG